MKVSRRRWPCLRWRRASGLGAPFSWPFRSLAPRVECPRVSPVACGGLGLLIPSPARSRQHGGHGERPGKLSGKRSARAPGPEPYLRRQRRQSRLGRRSGGGPVPGLLAAVSFCSPGGGAEEPAGKAPRSPSAPCGGESRPPAGFPSPGEAFEFDLGQKGLLSSPFPPLKLSSRCSSLGTTGAGTGPKITPRAGAWILTFNQPGNSQKSFRLPQRGVAWGAAEANAGRAQVNVIKARTGARAITEQLTSGREGQERGQSQGPERQE